MTFKRWSTIGLFLFLPAALAEPPFLTDDPHTLDYHQTEFYLFSEASVTDNFTGIFTPAMESDWGAFDNLTLHLLVPFATAILNDGPSTFGLSDTEVGAEMRFVNDKEDKIQASIYPQLELPTGDVERNLGNGKAWYKLPIWLQKDWQTWSTFGGGGYAINPAVGAKNFVYGGWAVEDDVSQKITLGGEVFYEGATSDYFGAGTLVNAGGYYNFTPHFSLLLSTGHSILGERDFISFLGLYWVN